MRHSKIIDYSVTGFYSFRSKANLGDVPDSGYNSIYTVDCEDSCDATCLTHIPLFGFGPGPPGSLDLKAEGNWWGADPPDSSWFSGPVDYHPWLGSPPSKRAVEFAMETTTPKDFVLTQNYPNPFNPSTVIEFQLPTPALTRIEVYNILGQLVRRLIDHELPAGSHRIVWDGTNDRGRRVASGIYLYRVLAGGLVESKKMVLLR